MFSSREARDLLSATCIGEVGECMNAFSSARGFTRYSVVKCYHPTGGEYNATDLAQNYPQSYLDQVYLQLDGAKSDPVMQYMKLHHTPIWWTRGTYEAAGCAELWENSVRLDEEMRGGVALALHLPGGWHLAVGMESREAPRFEAPYSQRVTADLMLFAAHAAEMMMSPQFNSSGAVLSHAELTARGVEVLRLVSSGKSNKQIADQLGITQRTVVKHLADCAERLDCASGRREEIVAQALRLSLL